MDFRFTNEFPSSRVEEIVSYLHGPRLWIPKVYYPDIHDWSQRVYQELNSGSKRAIIALSQSELAGVTIYQKHKKDPEALEIKNLTVRPDLRGRHIASFLLRNTEIEGQRNYGSRIVLCDAKATNLAIRFFLLRNRYRIIGQEDLYGLKSGEDLIFQKVLSSNLNISRLRLG